MSGAGLAGWIVEAMIASTLLMALVLLVRTPVRRAFGPRLGYALWALPALRLVLPPLPAGWRSGAAAPIARAGDTLVLIVGPAAPASIDPVAGPDWTATLGHVLAAGWAIGAAAFFLHHLVAHRRFCRRVIAGAIGSEERAGVRIVTSSAAPGPLAFGLWRRYVAFPIDFVERYDADERALALAHEIGHHQRGDLVANWAALAILALHWFNPVAWRAFRAFRTDQELANDARVLAGRTVADRHIYACAIVKTAHGGAVSATCHLHSLADLKGRLKMLTISPASRRRFVAGSTAIGALLVGSLGLTASGSSAAAISAKVQEAVGAPAALPGSAMPPATPAIAMSPVEPHPAKRAVAAHDGTSGDNQSPAGDTASIAPIDPDSQRLILGMNGDPNTRVEVQNIPAVSTANCGVDSGPSTSLVVITGKNQRHKIVLCADRIRKVTADAMTVVGNTKDIERNAYAQALAGLLDARTKAVADVGMTDADRARALAAIDTSIAEMKAQLARFD